MTISPCWLAASCWGRISCTMPSAGPQVVSSGSWDVPGSSGSSRRNWRGGSRYPSTPNSPQRHEACRSPASTSALSAAVA